MGKNEKLLDCVSLTGIDDYTDLNKLKDLYTQYPFLEFGVCFDLETNTNIKYAGYRLLKVLQTYSSLPLVAHLSERNVEKLFNRANLNYLKAIPWKRIQLNIDLMNLLTNNSLNRIFDRIETLCQKIFYLNQIIIPEDVSTRYILENVKIPYFIDILSDVSKGKGICPSSNNDWAIPYHKRFGFAGGISFENIPAVLTKVAERQKNQSDFVWIDMESSLKNFETGCFDLNKSFQIAQILQTAVKRKLNLL